MWSWRNVKLQMLLLCAALCAPCGLFAQTSPVSPTDAVRSEPAGYYAIIGAVVRPGVYRLPPSGVQLVQLVQLAGGLSDGASGAIRLLRNDRAGQQAFYSPNIQYELLPGDVLIVDEQPLADAGGSLQIALLHLLHRPVVLSVPPESASLRGLFGLLGQSQNSRLMVRLLIPGQGDRVYRADAADGVSVPACSVVMFAPETVDIHQTPLLPRAVNEPEAGPSVTPVGDETTAARPKLTQIPPPGRHEMRVANVSDVVRDGGPIELPDALPLPEARIVAPAPPRVRHASGIDEHQTVAGSHRPAQRASKPSRSARAAGGSLLFLFLVAATFGGVLTAGGWLVWRGVRGRSLRKSIVVKSGESRLESLIRNQLPVVTEKLAWPPDVPLYGRSESVRLRYDSGHLRADSTLEIPTPHMPLEAAAASARQTRPASVAVAPPAERVTPPARPEPQLRVDTPRHPAADPARTPQRAGVLERALMRMQESSR